MRRPQSLREQYLGKARADLMVGSGWWPHQPAPVISLEPPCETAHRRGLTAWQAFLNGWEGPFNASWFSRLFEQSAFALDHLTLSTREISDCEHLGKITIEPFVGDDETSVEKSLSFLTSLPPLRQAISFEIIGNGGTPTYDLQKAKELIAHGKSLSAAVTGHTEPIIRLQIVAHRADVPPIGQLLQALNPNAAIIYQRELDLDDTNLSAVIENSESPAVTMALDAPYCFPLQVSKYFNPDPLHGIFSAFDHLGPDQWGMVQILIERATGSWETNLRTAIVDPYQHKSFFEDVSDRTLYSKFSLPLFAVAVRLAASSITTFRHLLGSLQTFATGSQSLVPNTSEWLDGRMTDDERHAFAWAIMTRSSNRPGVLLNAEETAALLHVPAATVYAERLSRVKVRTRPAPKAATERGSVTLGENVHQGLVRRVGIPAELRMRHVYVCGQSGVGKTTTLLNLIVADLERGHGLAYLDPHGDGAKDLLCRVPSHRIRDVIYLNCADAEFPPALNILLAHDPDEKERIVSETVSSLQKFFPESWGPRLQHILLHVLATVVRLRGGTLREVRRLLTDLDFRAYVVSRLKDPDLLAFWHQEVPTLPTDSFLPVLNKLSLFLMTRSIRNIVCQRTAPNFEHILNSRKVLIVNLATGLLTPAVSGVLGSFIVHKISNAAFRRAAIPKEKRLPFFCYVDEFQNFANISTGSGFERILSEARKYNLSLTVANQYPSQLPNEVRHCIWGNVATAILFRVGAADAKLLSHEVAAEADELMALERGQALVRTGGSINAFNLATFPEPPRPAHDPTHLIVTQSRNNFARPREDIERKFAGERGTPAPPTAPKKPTRKKSTPPPVMPPDLDELIS